MKKMKRSIPKPTSTYLSWKRYVCSGCGYEYDPAIGDEENGVEPGTLFNKLPEDWICPVLWRRKICFQFMRRLIY